MDTMKRRLIERRIKRLSEGTGTITPEGVIKDARSPKSPLHDCFEWDDAKAGHEYRLQQARELIRSVRVEFTVDSKTVSTVRYVRDPQADSDEQGYVEVAKIRNDKDLSREVLAAELDRVKVCMERAKNLAIAFGLDGEIAAFIEQIDVFHRRLEQAA